MKTKYPEISFWELALPFVFWILFNLGLTNYVYKFPNSYAVFAIFTSALIIFWFVKFKNWDARIFPQIKNLNPFFLYVIIAMAVLVPLGIAVGFISFDFSWKKVLSRPLILFEIYFTIGLVEELVFRQMLLVYLWQKVGFNRALIWSSVIFGLFHITHGFPNWDYVLLATVAGFLYGIVFKRLGLGEAILLHSTVDAFKYIFF